MARILTLASGKGGVGKTTNSVLLSVALAKKAPGRTLLVDLDPNNNTTDMALRSTDIEEIMSRNIYHVLKGEQRLETAIFKSDIWPGLDIIPAVPRLAKIGREIGDNPAIYLKFPAMLKKLDYDYILIDTPPALTLELRIALYSSHLVLVPVAATRWTVQGFDLIAEEIADVKEATGKAPKLMALPSMVTEKRSVELREILPDVPFTNTSIIRMAALDKAGTEAKLPKEGSPADQLFNELASEVE